MKKILLDSNESYHEGYGAGEGTTEEYVYKCPCGQGTVIEEHDNIPGFREHDVFINCSYFIRPPKGKITILFIFQLNKDEIKICPILSYF